MDRVSEKEKSSKRSREERDRDPYLSQEMDGTSSIAGRSGNLSLDALAKAKKALQMQKELAEKLKKIPLVSFKTSML